MSGSSPLFNPAGGVRYHLRAWRHSATLWQPFRWALGEWLLDWKPPEKTLLLVGPSGGYNLQPFLFERFERVVCLEPDPVARWIFRRRLERAPLERRPELSFIAEDQLVEHPERFGALLARLDDPAILFSNVLGQLRVLLGVSDTDDDRFARVREAVQAAERGRSWASFHDRVSGVLQPALTQATVVEERWSDKELLNHAFAEARDLPQGTAPELLDHLTEGLFPTDLPHAYFSWELEPGWFHVIEAVRSVRPSATSLTAKA